MEIDLNAAAEIAQKYFGTVSQLTRLGWGISGFVYLSPDLSTAVTVYRQTEGFETELRAYRMLTQLKLTQLFGLTIPKLRDYRRNPNLIRMDAVAPPFLLDFAGVRFSTPDYSDDVLAIWRQGIDVTFGPNAWIAYAVHDALARHGIHYQDFRLSNMNLKGLPDLEPIADDNDAY